jgi:hypothetical protein
MDCELVGLREAAVVFKLSHYSTSIEKREKPMKSVSEHVRRLAVVFGWVAACIEAAIFILLLWENVSKYI